MWLIHLPLSVVVLFVCFCTLKATDSLHILSLIHLPKKKQNPLSTSLKTYVFLEMFFRCCDFITFVNLFGHANPDNDKRWKNALILQSKINKYKFNLGWIWCIRATTVPFFSDVYLNVWALLKCIFQQLPAAPVHTVTMNGWTTITEYRRYNEEEIILLFCSVMMSSFKAF